MSQFRSDSPGHWPWAAVLMTRVFHLGGSLGVPFIFMD